MKKTFSIIAVGVGLGLSTTVLCGQSFFEKHCTVCHGEDEQQGDIRLDDPDTMDTQIWELVYEQLVNKDMPPEDEPQPTEEEVEKVLDYIFSIQSGQKAPSSTGFRRLNKREYGNTVRDLLGLRKGIFDPSKLIYEDEIEHGFDTEADSLVISNELLLEYLQTAEKSLRVALFSANPEKPEVREIDVPLNQMKGESKRFLTFTKKNAIIRIGGGVKVFDGSEMKILKAPGRYKIRVTASGIDRVSYGGQRLAPSVGPLKLGIGVIGGGDQRISSSGDVQVVYDLKDDEEQTFEFETWIDQGYLPFLSFTNGAPKPSVLIRAGLRKKKLEKEDVGGEYAGPGIRITKYTIEGPFNDSWPPETFRETYAMDEIPDLEDTVVRSQLVRNFMSRAYRRPIAADEMTPYKDYLRKQYDDTKNWHEAMIRTFSAIMGSVDFLYRREPVGELDSFALASRLAYFFWSSMPDKELFRVANTGELKDEEIYKEQVLRLLSDSRVERFSRSFSEQWLSLDKLGTMPPDTKDKNFSEYYKRGLEGAMREETHLFFDHVFQENESILDFLDSDYSFLNQALADHYNMPFEGGKEFKKTMFPEGSVRGGLVGQGSIQTLTSNGVDTSPVERGHWIMDELLGTPPPPAPKEVPALTPDLQGVTTIRQQLSKHRSDPSCKTCHIAMDPAGFALESFDPIGRYRTRYSSNKTEVDASDQFLGRNFKDVAEFRKLLLYQSEPFARNLIIKIAEYAKGRKLQISDQKIVDGIVKRTARDGYRLKTIIAEIAISELMTHK